MTHVLLEVVQSKIQLNLRSNNGFRESVWEDIAREVRQSCGNEAEGFQVMTCKRKMDTASCFTEMFRAVLEIGDDLTYS